MLQSHVSEARRRAGAATLRGGRRTSHPAFFCNSGSEGVEAAIKFSRGHTGRDRLLYAEDAFHGLTKSLAANRTGALPSLRDDVRTG